jgi:hypothetical protein
MMILFRGAFWVAVCLAVIDAALIVLSSLQHAPAMLPVSAVVGGVFLAGGGLLIGIERTLSGAVRAAGAMEDQADNLRRPLRALTLILTIAGLAVAGVFGIALSAILQRMGEGFAVFG